MHLSDAEGAFLYRIVMHTFLICNVLKGILQPYELVPGAGGPGNIEALMEPLEDGFHYHRFFSAYSQLDLPKD